MNSASSPLLLGILNASFQAGLMAAVLMLVQRALGSRLSPAARHGLWWMVLVRACLPWSPTGPFHLPAALFPSMQQATIAPAVLPTPRPAEPRLSEARAMENRHPAPIAAPQATPGIPESPSHLAAPGRPPAPRRSLPPVPRASPPADSPGPIRTILGHPTGMAGALWVLGASILLARLGVSHLRFRRRVQATQRAADARTVAGLDLARRELGLPDTMAVVETDAVRSPALWGVERPVILLPCGFADSCTDAQLHHVLLHELAHLRRRDPGTHLLATVLAAIHWFNPLVWHAVRRIREERELAADAVALRAIGADGSRDYGRTIVHVLERWMSRTGWMAGVGILESPRHLRSRIEAIARFPGTHRRRVSALPWVGLLASVLLVDARPLPPPPPAPTPHPTGLRLDLEFEGLLQTVTAHPDLRGLRQILALPETRSLGPELTRRLAQELGVLLDLETTPGTRAAAAWIEVLDGLAHTPLLLQLESPQPETRAWFLAGRCGPSAQDRLASALADLRSASQPDRRPTVETDGPWIRMHQGNGMRERAQARAAAHDRETEPGRSPAARDVLRFEADLAWVARELHWAEMPPAPLEEWPRISGRILPEKDELRLAARLHFDRPHGIGSGPWNAPVDLLRDPLVSFTAIRGSSTWMSRHRWVGSTLGGEAPTTLFYWSQAGPPWLQYAACPTPDPQGLLKHLAQDRLRAALRALDWPASAVASNLPSDTPRLTVPGLPYFAPFLEASGSGDRALLLAGLTPMPSNGNPAPETLVRELTGRTNLVRYDWETSGARIVMSNNRPTEAIGRLPQLKELAQYGRLLEARAGATVPAAGPDAEIAIPGADWIRVASPLLGDTVTDLSVTGPDEMRLLRRSRLGLDSRELLRLLAWIATSPGAALATAPRRENAGSTDESEPKLTPEELADAMQGRAPLTLRFEVMDAESRQSVTNYQVLMGQPLPGHNDPNRFAWSPADVRPMGRSRGVRLHWATCWNGVRFAVVTEDGRVAESPVYLHGGSVSFSFLVRRRPAIAGTVLGPDGSPVDATLIVPDGGTARPRSPSVPPADDPMMDDFHSVTADSSGRFTLPPLLGGSRICVIHPKSGYAEVVPGVTEEAITVRLQPWGRVEGRIPGDFDPRFTRVELLDPIWPGYTSAFPGQAPYHAFPDTEGRFVLDRVPPGTRMLRWTGYRGNRVDSDRQELLQRLGIPAGSVFHRAIDAPESPSDHGHLATVRVPPGETVRLPDLLPGRTVTGKLAGKGGASLDPNDLLVSLHALRPPGMPNRVAPFPSEAERRAWLERNRTASQEFHPGITWRQSVSGEGRFRCERVPAGRYMLAVTERTGGNAGHILAARDVDIAPAGEGRPAEAIDLGTVEIWTGSPRAAAN